MPNGNLDVEFYNACRDGKVQEVKRLLAAGSDVNANFRPLDVASQHGHLEVVRCLLDSGAAIYAAGNNDRNTVMYNACRNGFNSMVDLLAFRGANVEKQFNRCTPLLGAAIGGHVSAAETLVVFGAEIDAVNNRAQTALMRAVEHERVVAVRLLLWLNADTSKIDYLGKTAFQLTKNDEMKQLLLDHEKKSYEERKQLAKETLISLQHKVGVRLMRLAQPEIIGICLAFAPLELPPYVLLWIMDFLPNYNLLSHHKKIELITSVRNSIWKLKERKEVRQRSRVKK